MLKLSDSSINELGRGRGMWVEPNVRGINKQMYTNRKNCLMNLFRHLMNSLCIY